MEFSEVFSSSSFHTGTTSKHSDLDENSTSPMSEQLIRSDTLLLKLTSIVEDLGEKIQILDEENIACHKNHQLAMGQVKIMKEELQSTYRKLEDLEFRSAEKEKQMTWLLYQHEERGKKLTEKTRLVLKLHEDNQNLKKLLKKKMEEIEKCIEEHQSHQNELDVGEINKLKKQLQDIIPYKEKYEVIVDKLSHLEQSVRQKNECIKKLQLNIKQASDDKENYTNQTEKVVSDLYKIKTQLERTVKMNGNSESSLKFSSESLCNALSNCNEFAQRNTQKIDLLLNHAEKLYQEKWLQVEELEKEIYEIQNMEKTILAANESMDSHLLKCISQKEEKK